MASPISRQSQVIWFLHIVPSLMHFALTLRWIIFGGPPPPTTSEDFIWLLQFIFPVCCCLLFLLINYQEDRREWASRSYYIATRDTTANVIRGSTVMLALGCILWYILYATVSTLTPLTEEGSVGLWFSMGVFLVCLVLPIGSGLAYVTVTMMTYGAIWKEGSYTPEKEIADAPGHGYGAAPHVKGGDLARKSLDPKI